MSLHKIALGGVLASLCSNAFASGFAISGKSVSALGNALAGSTVSAEDASVVYGNPAAMRALEGRHFSTLLHAIPSDVHFDNTASNVTGTPTQQVDKVHFVPGLYYVNTLNDEVSVGLGIYSPFGLGLEYDDSWVGRYHSTSSSLRTINISPAIAFRASDKLNLGVGIDFQYAEAELKKAVDFGTICAAYEGLGAVPVGTCAAAGLQPQQDDGSNTLSGSNWAVGYSLGLTYDLNEKTRLGMSFHSATRHDVSGDSEFRGVPAIFTAAFSDSKGHLTLMLPETLSLGAKYAVSPKLEVMADYTWAGWSRFDQLVVNFDNGLPASVEQNGWHNSHRYALGMNYHWQDNLLLRAGVVYDQTPIPNLTRRTARVPDSDKMSIGLGSKFAVNKGLDIDMAVFYTLPASTEISNTDSLGHTLTGAYEVQTTYLSMQLNWKI